MNFSSADIDKLLDTLASQLKQRLDDQQITDVAMVGIHSGGAWVARELHQRLALSIPLGTLDISFYRDDFGQRGLNPQVKRTTLPFEVDGQSLILVDDVLMSGRTVRAAMNELFDFGRPAHILLAVLFDVGRRELPIQADFCGQSLALEAQQRVELHGPEPLTARVMTREG